jgi:hypothetical protein
MNNWQDDFDEYGMPKKYQQTKEEAIYGSFLDDSDYRKDKAVRFTLLIELANEVLFNSTKPSLSRIRTVQTQLTHWLSAETLCQAFLVLDWALA